MLNRFEAAIAQIAEVGALGGRATGDASSSPSPSPPPRQSLTARCHPSNAHIARVGSMVRFGDTSLDRPDAPARRSAVLTVAPTFDRIMAYPELAVPAYRLLARYDRTRLLPGVDAIPPDSVTLLETNPRFVAAFLAGLNHELNRELLWRRYPTDQRGTPMRRFWDRLGGRATPTSPRCTSGAADRSLVDVAGGESNLVLLIRGELLRRYPNTVVLAIPASGPGTPSTDETMVKRPIFAGFLDPDVTFFGFDLDDDDLPQRRRLVLRPPGADHRAPLRPRRVATRRGALDRVAPGRLAGHRRSPPATPFTVEDLRAVRRRRTGCSRCPTDGATVAEALFQNPVQVLVHARHLAVHRGGLMPDLDLDRDRPAPHGARRR